MITVVAFVLAAAAGGALRFWARGLANDRWPLGTLAVNLAGSFCVGIIAAWSPPVATIIGTAGLGALTTYSTFAAEVVDSWRRSRTVAVGYAVVSIVGGVTLAWAGLLVAG